MNQERKDTFDKDLAELRRTHAEGINYLLQNPDMPTSMKVLLEAVLELAERVAEYGEINIQLLQDLDYFLALSQAQEDSSTQVMRRSAFRAAFAWIEGTVFQIKQIALGASHVTKKAFTQGELAVLAERQYRLSNTGKVEHSRWDIELKANLRFAFRALAQSWEHDLEIDAGGQDWQRLHQAIQIRNRLTHPKAPKDLIVSDEEISLLKSARDWHEVQLRSALNISMLGIIKAFVLFRKAQRLQDANTKQSFSETANTKPSLSETKGGERSLTNAIRAISEAESPVEDETIKEVLSDLRAILEEFPWLEE